VETQTKVTGEASLGSKGHGQWEQKIENRFSRKSSTKVDRFTSKWSPAHSTSSNTFHQRNASFFV